MSSPNSQAARWLAQINNLENKRDKRHDYNAVVMEVKMATEAWGDEAVPVHFSKYIPDTQQCIGLGISFPAHEGWKDEDGDGVKCNTLFEDAKRDNHFENEEYQPTSSSSSSPSHPIENEVVHDEEEEFGEFVHAPCYSKVENDDLFNDDDSTPLLPNSNALGTSHSSHHQKLLNLAASSIDRLKQIRMPAPMLPSKGKTALTGGSHLQPSIGNRTYKNLEEVKNVGDNSTEMLKELIQAGGDWKRKLSERIANQVAPTPKPK